MPQDESRYKKMPPPRPGSIKRAGLFARTVAVAPVTTWEGVRRVYALLFTWFGIWIVIMAAVVGSMAQNSGGLLNQASFWNLYFKKFYRKFTSLSCDRTTTGCASTIEFVVPQNEISGVTVFLWIIIAPLCAFAYQIVLGIWRARRSKITDYFLYRTYDDIVIALLIVVELFLLVYLRAAGGDPSLASLLGLCGLWISIRYTEMVSSSLRFIMAVGAQRPAKQDDTAPTANDVAVVSAPARFVVEPAYEMLKTVVMRQNDAPDLLYGFQTGFHYVIALAPHALFWTAFFLPIGTAMSNGGARYSYVVAHFVFFAFHMLETEIIFRQFYRYIVYNLIKGCYRGARAVTTEIDKFHESTYYFYEYGYPARMVVWTAKAMATALVLYAWDVSTSGTLVTFNLVA